MCLAEHESSLSESCPCEKLRVGKPWAPEDEEYFMFPWGENPGKLREPCGDFRCTEARLHPKGSHHVLGFWDAVPRWPSSVRMLCDIWAGEPSPPASRLWDSAGGSQPWEGLHWLHVLWNGSLRIPILAEAPRPRGREKAEYCGPFLGSSFRILLSAVCSIVSFLPRKHSLWITCCLETGLLKMPR